MTKTKQMTTEATTTDSTPQTLESLTATRDTLVTEVEAKQTELSVAKYDIDFDNTTNINRIMKHIDKSNKWTIKDAALTINLYDNLKLEKAKLKATDTEGANVQLGAIDLNSLYKSLTTMEGTGIETARNFITLLTNVGSQISTAMQLMGDANKSIQEMHVQLAELDGAIDEMSTEKVEADEVIE